jgi:hypothetical protein
MSKHAQMWGGHRLIGNRMRVGVVKPYKVLRIKNPQIGEFW